MPRLLQHRLDPASRLARLVLAEYGVAVDLEDVKPWRREPQFLELNPAATVPILIDTPGTAVGILAVIQTIEDRYAPDTVPSLIPADTRVRAETWRLLEWVLMKLNDEVTRYVLEEKIVKRDRPGMSPDPGVLRVAKANLAEHMLYFNWLFATRQWVAGDMMSLADFALAAHLSSLDYLGDVLWDSAVETRDWYARIKSRPAFRTLLNDRVAGMPSAPGYANLDF